jgi:hypothetical protein
MNCTCGLSAVKGACCIAPWRRARACALLVYGAAGGRVSREANCVGAGAGAGQGAAARLARRGVGAQRALGRRRGRARPQPSQGAHNTPNALCVRAVHLRSGPLHFHGFWVCQNNHLFGDGPVRIKYLKKVQNHSAADQRGAAKGAKGGAAAKAKGGGKVRAPGKMAGETPDFDSRSEAVAAWPRLQHCFKVL